MNEDKVHRNGKGAGCWMGVWCGKHCKAVNGKGEPCVAINEAVRVIAAGIGPQLVEQLEAAERKP